MEHATEDQWLTSCACATSGTVGTPEQLQCTATVFDGLLRRQCEYVATSTSRGLWCTEHHEMLRTAIAAYKSYCSGLPAFEEVVASETEPADCVASVCSASGVSRPSIQTATAVYRNAMAELAERTVVQRRFFDFKNANSDDKGTYGHEERLRRLEVYTTALRNELDALDKYSIPEPGTKPRLKPNSRSKSKSKPGKIKSAVTDVVLDEFTQAAIALHDAFESCKRWTLFQRRAFFAYRRVLSQGGWIFVERLPWPLVQVFGYRQDWHTETGVRIKDFSLMLWTSAVRSLEAPLLFMQLLPVARVIEAHPLEMLSDTIGMIHNFTPDETHVYADMNWALMLLVSLCPDAAHIVQFGTGVSWTRIKDEGDECSCSPVSIDVDGVKTKLKTAKELPLNFFAGKEDVKRTFAGIAGGGWLGIWGHFSDDHSVHAVCVSCWNADESTTTFFTDGDRDCEPVKITYTAVEGILRDDPANNVLRILRGCGDPSKSMKMADVLGRASGGDVCVSSYHVPRVSKSGGLRHVCCRILPVTPSDKGLFWYAPLARVCFADKRFSSPVDVAAS